MSRKRRSAFKSVLTEYSSTDRIGDRFLADESLHFFVLCIMNMFHSSRFRQITFKIVFICFRTSMRHPFPAGLSVLLCWSLNDSGLDPKDIGFVEERYNGRTTFISSVLCSDNV